MIPPLGIIPFNAAHADIPADWIRVTALDSNYLKISTLGWGDTGGNSVHSHNSPSHTHTYTSNGHIHATGTITNSLGVSVSNAGHTDSPNYDYTMYNHQHASANSGAMTNPIITSAAMTVSDVSNEQSRYELIFIQATKWLQFPVGGIVIRDDLTVRSKATHFDGLNGRYMKGAAPAADAGTQVDVLTHFHTTTHSHTLTHSHGNGSTGNTTFGDLGTNNTGGSVTNDHGHTVYFADHNEVVTLNQDSSIVNNDLAYQEVHFWEFTEQSVVKQGDLILFLDSELPIGWEDAGYNDVYLKGKTQGEALTAGGSNTHTHDDITHSHTGSAHTHTYTTSTKSVDRSPSNSGSGWANGTHSHTGSTQSGTNSNTGTSPATFDSANHEPPYVKIGLIRATAQALGGGGAIMLA